MTNTSRFNVYHHTIQLVSTPTAVKDMIDYAMSVNIIDIHSNTHMYNGSFL